MIEVQATVNLGRTATRVQDLVSKDKKLQKIFKEFGPLKYKKLGDLLKNLGATKSVFTRNALHFFLRMLFVETEVLGKVDTVFSTDLGMESVELGSLLADNLLSEAHPKLKEAKKLGLLPPRKSEKKPKKEATKNTRVTIVVLGENGVKLRKGLKRLGLTPSTLAKFQLQSNWGE